MKTARRIFELTEDAAGPACLLLLMLVLGLQVAGRAVGFGGSLTWTDEAARILFVWGVFLSLPLASKRGAMVHIRLSEKLWPRALRPYMPRLASALWRLSALLLAALSLLNIHAHSGYPQRTPVLGLNQNLLMLVVPLSFAMVFVRGFFKKLRS
ncbi:MAG: TRAP transporter small permease [Candidatus Adiutrix sp.]|jgi:TRAP-type C4-dicarboxylate transport system permease small subunit|nr:TRAP transporter small permease [Candidatus Adiutrix sp.]